LIEELTLNLTSSMSILCFVSVTGTHLTKSHSKYNIEGPLSIPFSVQISSNNNLSFQDGQYWSPAKLLIGPNFISDHLKFISSKMVDTNFS